MQVKLKELQVSALSAVAKIDSLKSLEDLRIKYLGKKGELTAILSGLGGLSKEERPLIGKISNEVKSAIAAALDARWAELENQEIQQKLASESIDITLPGRRIPAGRPHVLTTTLAEIVEVFRGLGYTVADGPEIEDDFHNFEALNIPPNHPARDMHDTFYLDDGRVLRTHTSPVQIRLMEQGVLPIKAIMPGRVYRCDADTTHSPVFHQVEGLVVGENITFGDLKGTLELFLKRMFGAERRVRFRNSFFPFTEPSAEVDVECFVCGGQGCALCKNTGWIEILGSGSVDPNVFQAVNIDPEKYTGFAFGLGVERIAMLKYGIKDIRLFYASDLRFLRQF
ncbi:phenylalanyl-tRNA synthetase subunit alpha [Candidatus Termititenax persephonae]|uniref:Phenylalanine--tRNA ligase alpha subunit n=1 Tax=Candidatus Termititenax persephonae TaxID=2218525 RepID=A0A388TFD4_9BACT|nr:phenylalanyl-tRNA synthetase subunit alpha [Candidatus Termititenax persephonae]